MNCNRITFEEEQTELHQKTVVCIKDDRCTAWNHSSGADHRGAWYWSSIYRGL